MSSSEIVRLTRDFLKRRSREFSIESILTLELSNEGISDLGCLGECIDLVVLNLSENDITKLLPLSSLKSLQHLDLSCNRVSNPEGLQFLEKLVTLNLAGNLIPSTGTLRCLADLPLLTSLRLRDEAAGFTNPACMHTSYKEEIINMFPKLIILDGEYLKGPESQFFKECEAIDSQIQNKASKRGPFKDVETPQPWTDAEFWREKTTTFEQKSMAEAEKQFTEVIESCKALLADVDKKYVAKNLTSQVPDS